MADGAVLPLQRPDGRIEVRLRFALDRNAGEAAVQGLLNLLSVPPHRTAYHLVIGGGRERELRIVGHDVGDVYVFGTRVLAKIREVGDLVPSTAAPPVPRTPPRRTIDVDARWSYEPPAAV